jgi:hypothetical protein
MLQDYSSSVIPFDTGVNNYGILANWCNFKDIKIWIRQLDELSALGVSSSDLEKCLHYEFIANIDQQITYDRQGSVPTQNIIRINLYVFPETVEAQTQTCVLQGWNQTFNSASVYYQRNPLITSSFNYLQWRSEYLASIDSSYIHSYSNLTTHQEIIDGFIAIVNGLYEKMDAPAKDHWSSQVTKQEGRLTISPYSNMATCIDVNTLRSNTPSASPYNQSLNMQNFETGVLNYYTNVKTFALDSSGDLQGWRYYNFGGLQAVPGLIHITPESTDVDEGGNITFNFEVENIADGDQVSWSLTNISDFSTISGTATITADIGSFTVTPLLDNTTEGAEIFTAEISYNGDTLVSADVTINDTSLDPPPSYNITPVAYSIAEGSVLVFNITTTMVPNGTVLYWEVSRPEDFSTASGFVTITGGVASFSVTPTADDTTEFNSFIGDETFSVTLRDGTSSGDVVAVSSDIIILDTSQDPVTGTSAPTALVVAPSPPLPIGNAGGGTGTLQKGSGIYQEWFQYTTASSEPSPSWREHVPDTQSIHIDLQYRPALSSTNDTPAGQQPNELPSDSWSAGASYHLYARWKDKATNISDLITTSFKIDNGDPYTVIYSVTGAPKVLNAGGHLAPKKIMDDYVYSVETVTDDHSGVVYYTHTVNGADYHKEVLATSYSQGRAAPNDEYMIDEQITIGSTPGNKTIEIRAYDQAENYKINSFNVIRSSQSIIWHTLTAQRSTISPFLVEGHLKVEITNTPELIAGFFGTVDLYNAPPDVNFDTSNSTHVIYDIPFAMTVPDMTVTRAIMHIMTDGSPRSYAQKGFLFTNNTNSATGGIASVAPPIVSIREATSRVYTNTRTNNYGVDAAAGAITPGGSKDRLTAFKITDTASSPGTPPVYNPATLKFEDQAAIGWRMYQDGTETITETESHQFSDPTYGSKTVYVHCCSHAYNGQVSPVPGSAQTFDNNYTLTYINDHKGPWLTSANVTEVTGAVNEACSQQGSDWSDANHNPISLWKRPSDITQDGAITISGTLEDNESEIKRWVVGPFASPPAYSEINPGLWTVLPTPTPTTSFSYSATLAPPNSTKILYVWAVDIVGNVGKHMISIDLNVPAHVSPPLGVTAGTPYKFEGKPAEHKERKSIASMFGDGVYHTGMISNQTPKVQANRVHKLSEYQGLRVYDTANDDNPVFLPSDTLKFSDFRDRQPRIADMNVVATKPPHDVFSPTEPQYVGDMHNIFLTMDIDTGDTIVHNNDNVVDDNASWTATFLPEGGGTTQIISSLNVLNGVIQNYIFANPGTYIFIGTSSFDYKVGKTFQIYKQGTPLPPTQGPPILVNVDLSNDPVGVTPVTIEYKVDQVGIALDAAIAIDRSGSYVSATVDDFAGALADASQTSRKVRLVLLEEGASPGANSPKSAGDRWSVLALFENIIFADEKTCLLHAFPNLKYLWDPTGTNTITSIPMHGSTSDFPIVSSLSGSAKVLETGTGAYSELAQSVRDGHDSIDIDPNSHAWNNSAGKNNRYWYTKAHHADDTLLRALDDFTRSSMTNAVNTRWRVSWFPFAGTDASAIGVDHVQGWTTKEEDVVDAINLYKDSPGYHDEPKITAIAELAKGVGLSAAQQPAWRQTAAKLILLFADEEDGGAQNAIGSEAKYKDSSHAEYFIKLLTKPSEEIGFVLMDGDRDNSFKDNGTTPYDPNRAVYKLNNMQDAVNLTAKYGGFMGALKVNSNANDISAEVKNAFDNYKAGVKFDIVSAISNPQIMNPNPQSNSIHSSGTPVPIPFGDLVAHPNTATLHYHRASFDVELNNAEINTLGVNYIILYVSVKNSSDMEIARREVRIRVV